MPGSGVLRSCQLQTAGYFLGASLHLSHQPLSLHSDLCRAQLESMLALARALLPCSCSKARQGSPALLVVGAAQLLQSR